MELIHNTYSLTTMPEQIDLAFNNFTKKIYNDLQMMPSEIENFIFESPVKGFKQRSNQCGVQTAKVWIHAIDGQEIYHKWQTDTDYMIIKSYIFEKLDKLCDKHGVPSRKNKFIAINYYPPFEAFDSKNPVFPYHTDFGYINCLLSNGPTMILDPEDNQWKEINLGNQMMHQVGGTLQSISNGKYKAIPHGVGRSPVIANNQGKISIVGVCDPDGPITLICGDKSLEIDGLEMIGIRFKGLYDNYQGTEDPDKEIYQTFLSALNKFERPC